MADILLDQHARKRLSKNIEYIPHILGISDDRLNEFRTCSSGHISFEEMAHVADALFPISVRVILSDEVYFNAID